MRSQVPKSSSKKGVVKPLLKAKLPTKKPISPKKKKLVSKLLAKRSKKNASQDDSTSSSEGDAAGDKKESISDNVKAGPSKQASTDALPKKSKKDSKEKKPLKAPIESSIKKVFSKKSPQNLTNTKLSAKQLAKNDDAKNKVDKNVTKKTKSKFSKAKTVVKKGNTRAGIQKKSKGAQESLGETENKKNMIDNTIICKTTSNEDKSSACDKQAKNISRDSEQRNEKIIESEDKPDRQSSSSSASSNNSIDVTTDKVSPTKKLETSKTETERPPKFFTSTRSPRMVDIDVKCFKNSKGNLSVSERFLSMKCESKSNGSNRDKPVQNTLVSQGPEIDVYTFTEKVDSPKSILSDFRSSTNKNVGRVRPIARVKGTVVDKTTESEKKKYSPHRPIEEVVQQLKASIRTEEVNSSPSSIDLSCKITDAKESDDTPKAIVSKSYKMVARKSSVTGKPFSPIKFIDQELLPSTEDLPSTKYSSTTKKANIKPKKEPKSNSSDDELDTSKFSLSTKTFHYSSSDESFNDSNDESKESSESHASKNKKTKNKRYRKIMDGAKRTTSKELKELSKDSLTDLKEEDMLLLGSDKPSKRRRKLLSMWNGPKKHRMASLNAIAKVHCLYENESRTHMELGLMRTVERAPIPSTSKQPVVSKKKEVKPKEPEKHDTTSESEYESKQEKKDDSSESSDDSPPQRTLRGVPGIRSAGKYWDPKSCTSSSEESELESKKKVSVEKKKIVKSSPSTGKSDSNKPPAKMKKTAGVPVKKKRNRAEVVMDLKDMVVQKRMASLNATAFMQCSYEKRSPKSSKDDTTSDSCSDESFSHKPKNGASSGFKSETKIEEPKKEKVVEEPAVTDKKQKVEVIVNQDTDVTITGVYSTHHREGFCTVSGLQYRISSTSHTQTTATANCEKVKTFQVNFLSSILYAKRK